MLWTDKKLFKMQAIHNNQNDWIYTQRKEYITVNEQIAYQCQKPASVMVWPGVTLTGEKTPLIFIEEGVKINQHVYLKLLKEQLIPWINRTFKETSITLQGAESHLIPQMLSRLVQGQYVRVLVKEFMASLSPDLNPMGFPIWSILESNLCSSSHQSVTLLKAKLRHCWDKISLETIHASFNQVSESFRRVVKAKGGYIEK